MTAARWPRRERATQRLLVIDPENRTWWDRHIDELPALLGPGDLLVVNDAATLPASLRALNRELEVRLLAHHAHWTAVVFGSGDWRTPTEDRPAPPPLRIGDTLDFGGLQAAVVGMHPASPRLVDLEFDLEGAALWSALYRVGRAVQYSYMASDVPFAEVQTPYAGRPWAMEMPSAGRPLTWSLLDALAVRGVQIARLTHAAGLSSTGDQALDALLPLPERYDLPRATVAAIERVRRDGGRVIAVGTSVVRALEGSFARHGRLVPGEEITDLVISPTHTLRVVDGLLSGMHEPGESHFRLFRAFADGDLLQAAHAHAAGEAYLNHEFGDSTLLLRTDAAPWRATPSSPDRGPAHATPRAAA